MVIMPVPRASRGPSKTWTLFILVKALKLSSRNEKVTSSILAGGSTKTPAQRQC